MKVLEREHIPRQTVRACASIDLKKDEEGLLAFAADIKCPISFYTAEELNSLEGEFSRSEFVSSVTSVDCVCERSAVRAAGEGSQLIVRKTSQNGVTVAVARQNRRITFE